MTAATRTPEKDPFTNKSGTTTIYYRLLDVEKKKIQRIMLILISTQFQSQSSEIKKSQIKQHVQVAIKDQ